MEIKKFDIDFVRRTKKILMTYKGRYKLSNLINCTLGLMVLPYENIRDNQIILQNPNTFWDIDINRIPSLPKIDIRIFSPIQRINKGGVITYYPNTLKVLLQKIRNGLAHQHIEPVNKNGKFVGIIISNYFDSAHQDLEIQFSRNQLEKFALFIANEYLKQV